MLWYNGEGLREIREETLMTICIQSERKRQEAQGIEKVETKTNRHYVRHIEEVCIKG